MSLRYPGGRPFNGTGKPAAPPDQSSIRYGHRGMTLEADLNTTNKYYIEVDRAVIYKKPTPVQIVHVDYPKRSAAKITEAYFRKPSTTDYNGIYRGKYIDFEAKETTFNNYIPLKNFHSHQVLHMKRVQHHGGIAFIIVKFSNGGDTYLLDAHNLLQCWTAARENGGRQSIPKSFFREKGFLIPQKYLPRIDYLHVVDSVYF